MPQKPRVDVRLHVMVTPSQKQRIEGAAERLRTALGRPVSEAQVVRAAIEQTDFSKLALTAAPAAIEEVAPQPTGLTTLTPEQAAIIESGVFPSYVIAGGEPGPLKVHPGFIPADWKDPEPKTLEGAAEVMTRLVEDGMIPVETAVRMPEGFGMSPALAETLKEIGPPPSVKNSFMTWASEDPLESDVPADVMEWLEDEIDVEKTDLMVDASPEPVATNVHYVVKLPQSEWLPCAMHREEARDDCPYCTTTRKTSKFDEAVEAKFSHFEPGDLGDYALKIREAQESALRERPA